MTSTDTHLHAPAFCAELQDALIDNTPLRAALDKHLAACLTCQGLYAMTQSIHEELKSTPGPLMHKPQWVAAVHQRQAAKHRRRLWMGGGIAVSLAGTLLWFLVSGQGPTAKPTLSVAPATSVAQPASSAAAPAMRPGMPPTQSLNSEELAGHCRIASAQLSCLGVSQYKPSKEAARQSARNAALEQLAWYLTQQAVKLHPDAVRSLPPPKRFVDNFLSAPKLPEGVGMAPMDYLTMVRTQIIDAAYADQASAADALALESWQAEMALRMRAVMDVDSAFATPREQWRWTEYESESIPGASEFHGEIELDFSLERMNELIDLLEQSPGFPLSMWTEQE